MYILIRNLMEMFEKWGIPGKPDSRNLAENIEQLSDALPLLLVLSCWHLPPGGQCHPFGADFFSLPRLYPQAWLSKA